MTFAPVTPDRRLVIAFREAGVAVAILSLAKCRDLVKVLIYPRTKVLGATESQLLVSLDKLMSDEDDLFSELYIVLAGTASEEVMCEIQPTFAGSRLTPARQAATMLVTRHGVSSNEDKIINDAYIVAKQFVVENRSAIARVAEALLHKSELTGQEVAQLVSAEYAPSCS